MNNPIVPAAVGGIGVIMLVLGSLSGELYDVALAGAWVIHLHLFAIAIEVYDE